MKIPFLRRDRQDETIAALYGAIVAQARAPALYSAFQVPDSIEGRFEMLVLHLSLAFDRLARRPETRGLGQGAFDLFCQDMDDHMREMGVGDLSVPKKMRAVADAFYGRQAAYQETIGDAMLLTAALVRNVYGGTETARARDLADYVRDAARGLAQQEEGELRAGRLAWPKLPAISALEAGQHR